MTFGLPGAGVPPASADNPPAAPATAPATEPAEGAAWTERDWANDTTPLSGERSFKDDVYTITVPRKDLWVQTDMGDIPTSAGIESRFHFFRCSCGKGKVVGEFVLADYEANDVIDALRAGHIDVVSVGPMFLGEKPRLSVVRFQGEGGTTSLAETIKTALNWTGDARTGKQPLEKTDH